MTRPAVASGAVMGTTAYRDGGWWTRAACKGADLDVFFHFGHKVPKSKQQAAVAAYCGACPVREECLADAVAKGDKDGVRGGVDMAEKASEGISHDASKEQRIARRAWMLTELPDLAEHGYSRTEAAITLKTSIQHIAFILRDNDLHHVLERLDANAKRIRLAPETPKTVSDGPDYLVLDVKNLIAAGYGMPATAQAVGKSVEALETALRRRKRHDLLQQLRRTA